jgi:hypothetical protein
MSRKALLKRLAEATPSPVVDPHTEFFQGESGPCFYTRQSACSGLALFETVLIAPDQSAIITGRFGLN